MNCYIKPGNRTILDPFFEAIFDGNKEENFGLLQMKTNVLESEKGYRLLVELPGFKKEDIDLSFDDGYLTIAVKTPEEPKEDEFKTIHRERFYGEANRRYYLGEIDEKGITASFENGVLKIEAPKLLPEETKPTKIQIM
ncbi:MAG: Hsp20/alpha crystallin family protein [Bacilli bacterium]|nr:Hsp20/alpha crystallin family protein [Bacilli bacterium]